MSISKEEILRVLNDKHQKETITEIEFGQKTLKTEEQQNHLMTFTQQINIDTQQETNQINQSARIQDNPKKNENFGYLELKMLTYFGPKDEVYQTLCTLNKKSLYFLRKNYKKIENDNTLQNANESIKLVQIKSFEEHNSGINQMLKVNQKELVTVSDDCTLKFWSATNFLVQQSISTETITCIAATGINKREILIAGCHSGNIIIINSITKQKKETINMAHYNLIRVIVSLEALKHRYFVTADVCGIVKVWTSQYKPQQVLEIEQDGAISYNSMIEVLDMLPKRQQYQDSAVIACALKQQKVNLILLIPSQGLSQVIIILKTQSKPTCLIQLSTKHLAIAVGSLKESSNIEIHNINKNKIVSVLKKHTDMIDSMLKLELPLEKTNSLSPYVTWLLSASRDRSIILWKLFDGRIMKRNFIQPPILNSQVSVQSKKSPKRSGESQNHEQSEPHNKEEQSNEQEQTIAIKQPQQQDYFFKKDTSHKDFIRSMVQLNDNTLLTASEDKTVKIFTISF